MTSLSLGRSPAERRLPSSLRLFVALRIALDVGGRLARQLRRVVLLEELVDVAPIVAIGALGALAFVLVVLDLFGLLALVVHGHSSTAEGEQPACP